MPAIYTYRCNQCDFRLPFGWGGIMYVSDDEGKRIVCRHPGEMMQVRMVLGNDATEELIRERTGFLSNCFCMVCQSQFQLDLKRDTRICPDCASLEVVSANEAVGHSCPKCKTGTIVTKDTGIMT